MAVPGDGKEKGKAEVGIDDRPKGPVCPCSSLSGRLRLIQSRPSSGDRFDELDIQEAWNYTGNEDDLDIV